MMRDHELIEQLIAIRSVGGLDPADEAVLLREMASHGPDCEECRRLEAEYAEVAGRLGFALAPVALREGFEDETIARALGETRTAEAPPRAGAAGWVRTLVAVAAALVLFAGGWLIGSNVSNEVPVPSNATVVAFQGESGTVTAAFTPGQAGVYLVGSDLPALPENQVYELWLFHGDQPASALCAAPKPDGSLFAFADTPVEAVNLMAVTVEPSACPDAPTTDPVYVAQLTA